MSRSLRSLANNDGQQHEHGWHGCSSSLAARAPSFFPNVKLDTPGGTAIVSVSTEIINWERFNDLINEVWRVHNTSSNNEMYFTNQQLHPFFSCVPFSELFFLFFFYLSSLHLLCNCCTSTVSKNY